MMRKLAYALPATLSLALVACGGGPDLDQVKADFNSPNGSVKNKDAMVAGSSNLDASGSAGVVLGGGVPGASLTAYNKHPGFASISARPTWEPRARAVRDFLNGRTTSQQALTEAQTGVDACGDSAEAQEAFQNAFGDIVADAANPFGNSKKISGSASYTQDFSACSNGELSGSAKIEIKIEAEQTGENSGRFAFTVTYEMNEVCELNTEERACLSGTMIVEAEAIGQEEFGSLTFTSAWDLDGKWTEDGADREAHLKGGIRTSLEGDGTSGSAKIEVLTYVSTPEGEWSYVWSFEGAFDGINGTATIECRGNDGSVSCTIDENGGTCTASDGSSITWTAADEASLGEDWFKG